MVTSWMWDSVLAVLFTICMTLDSLFSFSEPLLSYLLNEGTNSYHIIGLMREYIKKHGIVLDIQVIRKLFGGGAVVACCFVFIFSIFQAKADFSVTPYFSMVFFTSDASQHVFIIAAAKHF